MRRHGAPWTLFVTTDFADGQGQLWWLELEEAVARLERVVVDFGGEVLSLPSHTLRAKKAAFETIYWRLRSGPEHLLRAATAELAGQAGLTRNRLSGELCLSWDELEIIAREPEVTVGAHTLSHQRLAKLDARKAAREIAGSRAILQRRLGRPVRHFAYPIGDAGSASVREFRMACEAGFATAVTTRPGHLFPAHAAQLHALPRVAVNGYFQNKITLRALLSGVPFLPWNRGRVAE